MKVSVIVPVYNMEKYLKRCLDSLVNQTLKDIEIIVINDCSTDNSKFILKEYQEKYKNIKVLNNKTNKGIGYNRNLGIKTAIGDYISFIDSDDYVERNMYEVMYNKAKKDNLDLVICRYFKELETDDKTTIIENDYPIPFFNNTTLKNNPSLLLDINLSPWNKLYKKTLLMDDLRFPLDLKYEDAIFTIKALVRAKKIGMVEACLNHYLIRSKSETTTMNERVFDILNISNQMLDELKKEPYYNDIKEYVEAFIVRNLFRYTIQQKKQKDKVLANKFIDDAFDFINTNFSNYKNNVILRRRNKLKWFIESNKTITKLFIKL